jgi:hypothetical protein
MSNLSAKSEVGDEFDKIKFMYDKTYDELNRCRDWPIKVMTFVSAFFVLLIGFVNLRPENVGIVKKHSLLFIVLVSAVTIWTVVIIIIQHLRYLTYRKVQINLQRKMNIQDIKLNDKDIFPKHWTESRPRNLFTGFQGWFFYVLFMLSLATITITILWKV